MMKLFMRENLRQVFHKSFSTLDVLNQNTAVRALPEASNKKIMSYQELNQIIKVFDTKLNRHEKKQFLYSK